MSNLPPQQPSPYGTPPVQAQPQQGKSNTMIILIILGVVFGMMLVCGGVLVALLLPAVGAARSAAQRMSRQNNVKQVGLAIHNYHSAFKQLPLTVVTDSDGQEIGGWRVGLSPFAEGQRQWETYLENNNSRDVISSDPPAAFQANEAAPGETNMFAIVAPNSMFPPTPNTKVQFRDTLDGLANTAMIIELPNRTTNWTSNENMTPDQAYQAIQELESGEVGHLLMGDGAVIPIVANVDREFFDAIVTRDGGEEISAQLGM